MGFLGDFSSGNGSSLVEHPLPWLMWHSFPVSPWKKSEVCVELLELSQLPSRHFFPDTETTADGAQYALHYGFWFPS